MIPGWPEAARLEVRKSRESDLAEVFRQDAVDRFLVVAEAEEDGLTQLAVCRPFLERDLRYQPRRKPGRAFLARWICEGRARDHQWPEGLGESGEGLFSKSRADFADEVEILAVVGAEQQRAEMLAAAFGCGEAADDELFLLMRLDLEPFPRAALLVRRVAVLGDNSFEAFALGDVVGGETVLGEAARNQELFRRFLQHGLELVAAARERFAPEIAAATINAIEHGEGLRDVAALEQLKSRNPLRVEGDDLAVEQRGALAQLSYGGGDGGKGRRAIEVVARQQRDLCAFLISKDSVAVVFFLVHPTGLVKRLRHE